MIVAPNAHADLGAKNIMKSIHSTGPALISAISLLACGQTGIASAHSFSGSLGNSAGATDYYQITCSNDGNGPPADLITNIKSTVKSSTPRISVQARVNISASNATDPTNGDTNPSPSGKLTAGAGLYDVLVFKDGTGPQNYVLVYHCLTSKGVHTGTTDSPPPVQDQ